MYATPNQIIVTCPHCLSNHTPTHLPVRLPVGTGRDVGALYRCAPLSVGESANATGKVWRAYEGGPVLPAADYRHVFGRGFRHFVTKLLPVLARWHDGGEQRLEVLLRIASRVPPHESLATAVLPVGDVDAMTVHAVLRASEAFDADIEALCVRVERYTGRAVPEQWKRVNLP